MVPPNHHHPPRWIRKLLALFLEARTLEACLGDLEEKFRARHQTTARWRVNLNYIVEALGFLRMAKRQPLESTQTAVNLVGHTLLFFGRLVRKDKGYYVVSLSGLAISLASFLLIMLFIADELSYDQFHEKRDRLFRVVTHVKVNDVHYDEATSQFPLAKAFQSEFAEVEEAIRIFPQERVIASGDKKFNEQLVFADEKFFDVFTFQFLRGNKDAALTEPASIVLTETTAKKYFGSEDPLGRMLVTDGQSLRVTGVIGNVPVQSHMKFDAVIPLSLQLNFWKSQTGIEGRENKWYWTGAYTYLLLKPGVNAGNVESGISALVNKYLPERFKKGGRFELQPLTGIHLKSHLDAEMEPGGSLLYIKLFSIVALVIMIVSSINLINLSWFKISSRVRELGVRKFLGQNAGRIVVQLAIESALVGVLAFLLALLLSQGFLSRFNLLVNKNLQLWSAPNRLIVGGTLALIIGLSLVSILRPAFVYATRSSNFLLLKAYRNPSSAGVRNLLIGLQVCFSFVLLVFSFIVAGQINFFKSKDLGFEKENVLIINLNPQINGKLEAFKNELKKNKEVVDVAGGGVPGTGFDAWRFVPEGGSREKPLMFAYGFVDYSFLNTLSIRVLAGKNFDPNENYDSLLPYIINKRAAIEMGWLDDPLNKTIEIFAPGTTEIMAKGRVIGLIDDYHFESLHRRVKPVVLTVSPYFGQALIRLSGAVSDQSISAIASTWKKFSDQPFEYELLDKNLEKLYSNETQLSHVILFFTFIALYLTCYGLFAMSSLLFTSRLKEVAIRKVFGAGQFAIVGQLYGRYALFNLVAILIGIPIAIYVGNLWLETFQYRISLTSGLFFKAGICILTAGLLSVSYYLARVALSNPVRFLRRD